MLKKIAVIFGGRACEREVSIITGTLACNLLRGGKYDVLPIYLDEQEYSSCLRYNPPRQSFVRT